MAHAGCSMTFASSPLLPPAPLPNTSAEAADTSPLAVPSLLLASSSPPPAPLPNTSAGWLFHHFCSYLHHRRPPHCHGLMANPLDTLQDQTVKDQEASASNMLNGPASDQPVRVAGGPSVLCQRSWTGTPIKPSRAAFPPSSSIHKEEEQASALLRLNGSGCHQLIRPPAPVSAAPPADAAPALSNSSGMGTPIEPSRVALTPSASNAEVTFISQHSVFKSNTFSSKRTQAADICHEVHAENMERRSKFNHRANLKKKKLSQTLNEVHGPRSSHAHKWSEKELLSVQLVFDGGNINNPPLTPPVPKAGSIQTIEKDKNASEGLKVMKMVFLGSRFCPRGHPFLHFMNVMHMQALSSQC